MKRFYSLLYLLLPLVLTACAGTNAAGLCDYDYNDDGLYEDEFTTGIYDEWDANDDDILGEDEFETGLADYGWDSDEWGADFDTWDDDEDGYLTSDEFGVGFDEAGLWDTWDTDADGYLDDNECEVV